MSEGAVSEKFEKLSREEFDRLAIGDPVQVARLRVAARVAGASAFVYPAKGPVVVFFTSDGSTVRLSEGGRLLRYLESQGMDVTQDVLISKTVYRLVSEVPGSGLGNGEVYLDTAPDAIASDLPRFLQLILETIGLRHSKYKDALVKLASADDGALL
jgi:hypothetical protein